MSEEVESDDEDLNCCMNEKIILDMKGSLPCFSGLTFFETTLGYCCLFSQDLVYASPSDKIVSNGVFRVVQRSNWILHSSKESQRIVFAPSKVSSITRLSDHVYSCSKHIATDQGDYFIGSSPSLSPSLLVNNPLWIDQKQKLWINCRALNDSKQFLSTEADIRFLTTPNSNYISDCIYYPTAEEPKVDDEIYCIGYPNNYEDEKIEKWLKMKYQRNKILENIVNPMDILRREIPLIREMFPNGIRVLSVGKVKEFKDGIIVIDASLFPGMKGGSCLNREGKLLGSLIGSDEGENYNKVLSVLHPSFMYGYKEHVLPDLREDQKCFVSDYEKLLSDLP